MYIFEALPIDLWVPTIKDLEKIRKWLQEFSPHSEENKTLASAAVKA